MAEAICKDRHTGAIRSQNLKFFEVFRCFGGDGVDNLTKFFDGKAVAHLLFDLLTAKLAFRRLDRQKLSYNPGVFSDIVTSQSERGN